MTEPKIGWKTFPVTAPLVATHLAETQREGGAVMISEKNHFRGHRRHLKLHHNRSGVPFVRIGVRGSSRQELEFCDVTYLDGVPTIFAYVFKKSELEKEWEAAWDRKHGIGC